MFDATAEIIESGKSTRYVLTRGGAIVSFAEVLDLWQSDSDFRRFFNQLLADSPFPAYRWETPALTKATARRPFEFVLLNTPGFCTRETDRLAFKNHFTTDDTDFGIVSFRNLGGDATLVVPSPRTDIDAYGHLASFIRQAPQRQRDALWRVVATSVQSQIGDKPLWLSTAGGGVAWLHVRLDSRPKYYGYAPYRFV